MKDVSIDVESMGFDFTITENFVHLQEDKIKKIGVDDVVTINVKDGNSFKFKVTKLYFNGFEYSAIK